MLGRMHKGCLFACVPRVCRYPVLTVELQSTQRTVTFSRSSPPSLLPQGMWKSLCSLRAPRRDSMVSGGICTINPSDTQTASPVREQTVQELFFFFMCSFTGSFTFHDARFGDEARRGFQGSIEHHKTGSSHCDDTTRGVIFHAYSAGLGDNTERLMHLSWSKQTTGAWAEQVISHLCGSSQAYCWPESDSCRPRSENTPGASRLPGWNVLQCWWRARWTNSPLSASVR